MRLDSQQIPDGWRICRFGDITRIANGMIDPSSDGFQHMLHVGPENIESDSGRVVATRTAEEIGLVSGKYLFDEHAILYSKIRPNLNKVCVPGFKGLCSADMYPIWTDQDVVDAQFLCFAMTSQLFLAQAIPMSMRTGMPKINRSDLNGIKVLVPSVIEQRQIVSILSTCNRAIEIVERLITAKLIHKRSLLQRLVDLARFNWPTLKLGELFKNRKAKGDVGLPTYSVTMNRGLVPRDSLDRKSDTALEPEQHLLIEEGDIAYNMMRMWQGASGLASEAGLVSPAYVVIRSRGKVDPAFASYWFKMPRVVKKFQDYSHGLTKDRLRLYYKDFATIALPLPPLKLQQHIAKAMQCCDRELDVLERKLALLKQQKKGLMQQLLTGKTRVKLPKGAA